MIVLAGMLTGALWGAGVARRRQGNGLDIAQYAAAYGILFGLVGLFATVLAERLL
ncbi:MAG: hypothetical protein KJZ85_20140 [Rhodobacteraceae bacterium]|jgi:hypothetical protein|nr:hypothetical protein [Paracoccaceae bacterium]